MKKFLSLVLIAALALSVAVLTGCGGGSLKFGTGVYVYVESASDATADEDGAANVVVTVAAVLVDANGKIVKAKIDVLDAAVNYTASGAAVPAGELISKYEQGDNYNMVEYGGSVGEWYQEADAFCSAIAGKTISEVKGMVVNGKGNDDIINAGCTIYVSDFVKAIEKAVANASDSRATKNATLSIGMVGSADGSNATATEEGTQKVEIYATGVALDASGKVITATSECVATDFTFNNVGKAGEYTLTDKRAAGDDYNMVEYGGSVGEWYQEADALDALMEGKTADEISALMASDYKGTEEVQNAGCTIYVSGLIGAAVKAATV